LLGPYLGAEFEKALVNDKPKVEIALMLIQQLYAVEAQAREQKIIKMKRTAVGKKALVCHQLHWQVDSEEDKNCFS